MQEVVLHLMDSDLVGSDRMKRVIAEPSRLCSPTTRTCGSSTWATTGRTSTTACEVFRLNRKMTAAILRRYRTRRSRGRATTPNGGSNRSTMLVQGYIDHLHHHLKFVREKRAKLGKPMA